MFQPYIVVKALVSATIISESGWSSDFSSGILYSTLDSISETNVSRWLLKNISGGRAILSQVKSLKIPGLADHLPCESDLPEDVVSLFPFQTIVGAGDSAL